jgi:hypothetical protein
MSRNLKLLGLALVAVAVLGAMLASAAEAKEFKFSSATGKSILTGTTDEGFSEEFFANGTSGVGTKCTAVNYDGTVNGNSVTELTIKPTDKTGCTTFSSGDSEIKYNHCAKILKNATSADEHAAVKIECATGSKIETIAAGGSCILKFGEQEVGGTTGNGVHYTNREANGVMHITVETTVMNLTYEAVGAFCALGGISQGVHTTGGYLGRVTLKAYEYSGTIATGTALTTPGTTIEGTQTNFTFE